LWDEVSVPFHAILAAAFQWLWLFQCDCAEPRWWKPSIQCWVVMAYVCLTVLYRLKILKCCRILMFNKK